MKKLVTQYIDQTECNDLPITHVQVYIKFQLMYIRIQLFYEIWVLQ